jgi:hypothetical protein
MDAVASTAFSAGAQPLATAAKTAENPERRAARLIFDRGEA